MSVAVRWALVVVVLAVASAVALWPRGNSAGPGTAPATSPAPDLAADRARAALAPCPHPGAIVPAGSAFRGVRVTCAADGASVDLGALLSGAPTLVNVWATWCVPCQRELPTLAGYAAEAGAIGVLEVQVQSDQRDGLATLAGLGVHLPAVFDGAGAAASALRLPVGLPASYLVRADGTATLVTQPRVFESAAEVRQAVARYLGPGAVGTG